MNTINIGNKTIGNGRTYIIAEIGSNHNQDFNQALEMIDLAKECGADAVKFQSIDAKKLMKENELTKEDIELFDKIKLEESWYEGLFQYAKKRKIDCFSAPTYLEAVDLLTSFGTNLIKIASPQTFGCPPIIEAAARTGLPVIISTGYCMVDEIDRAITHFKKYGDVKHLILLHCVSEYPTRAENVNLQNMESLRKRYNLPVGFSDHTKGLEISYAAVAMGACAIEKHITISRKEEGPDHYFAIEPDEFKQLVAGIRRVEAAFGKGEKQIIKSELEVRENLVVYPYAATDIVKDEIITKHHLEYYRSHSSGLSPWDVEKTVIGKRAGKFIAKGSKLIQEDLI